MILRKTRRRREDPEEKQVSVRRPGRPQISVQEGGAIFLPASFPREARDSAPGSRERRRPTGRRHTDFSPGRRDFMPEGRRFQSGEAAQESFPGGARFRAGEGEESRKTARRADPGPGRKGLRKAGTKRGRTRDGPALNPGLRPRDRERKRRKEEQRAPPAGLRSPCLTYRGPDTLPLAGAHSGSLHGPHADSYPPPVTHTHAGALTVTHAHPHPCSHGAGPNGWHEDQWSSDFFEV